MTKAYVVGASALMIAAALALASALAAQNGGAKGNWTPIGRTGEGNAVRYGFLRLRSDLIPVSE